MLYVQYFVDLKWQRPLKLISVNLKPLLAVAPRPRNAILFQLKEEENLVPLSKVGSHFWE